MDIKGEQFSGIYDEYIEKIYRFVYLKVNSVEVAQDISSKVFLKAWEAFKQEENIDSIGSFIYKIAHNCVVDHYRSKDKERTIPTDYIAQLADNGRDLHQSAIINSEMQTVMSAISGLKKEYQDVLIWHFIDDMSADEISKIIDKSPGAVRVTLHRALKVLKGKFDVTEV